MKPLPQGEPLFELARKLGVTFHSAAGSSGFNEAEIQARVLAVLRERRDRWTWVIALASAIASAFSALAAWTAILIVR